MRISALEGHMPPSPRRKAPTMHVSPRLLIHFAIGIVAACATEDDRHGAFA